MKNIKELKEEQIKDIKECPFLLDKKHTYKYLMNKFQNSKIVDEIIKECEGHFDPDDVVTHYQKL